MTIFRKSALIFIAAAVLLAAAWIYVARNGLIESTARTALERMFEAPVEIKGLVFNPFTLQAGFQRLRIANADHPDRWLIEAGPAAFDVNMVQLFGKKLVIRDFSLQHVDLGTERPEGVGAAPRPKPAPAPEAKSGDKAAPGKKEGAAPAGKPAPEPKAAAAPKEDESPGFLAGLVPEMDFSGLQQEFSVDNLMQGRQLGAMNAINTTKEQALGKIGGWQQRLSGTTIPQDLRSVERDSQALRFNVKNPDDLKALQSDLQSLKKRLDGTQKELNGMTSGWQQDQKSIKAGWDSVGAAAAEDFKTIRAAAKLPNLDAAQIGKSVFGSAVIGQFNSMLSYARIAQKALRSDSAKSEAVPRRAGRWIAYPVTARVYPGFALERSIFSGALSNKQGQPATTFDGRMLGLSSDAKVFGAPLTVTWDGKTAEGRHWTAEALFDQRALPTKTNIVIRGTGIGMGTVNLSDKTDGSMPQRLAIPQADVEISFRLTGDALGGGLAVVARKITFQYPPGTAPAGGAADPLRAIFADFQNVELRGTLSGTLSKPKFDLKSSIDDIISARLKALVGKRVAEIDRQIRSAVDAQVNAARAGAEAAVSAQQAKLDQALGEMDQRSKQVQQTVDQKVKQAEAELKRSGDRAKKEAEAGAKKALEDRAKGVKLPKR